MQKAHSIFSFPRHSPAAARLSLALAFGDMDQARLLANELPQEKRYFALTRSLIDACSPPHDGRPRLSREAEELNACKAIRFIAEFGLDLNEPNEHGAPPLFAASRLNKTHVCLTLLELGADPNPDLNSDFLSPLFCALQVGNGVLTLALLNAGAALNQTALDEIRLDIQSAPPRSQRQCDPAFRAVEQWRCAQQALEITQKIAPAFKTAPPFRL